MSNERDSSASLWSVRGPSPRYGELRRSITTDVCVVGGGIAGATIAYLLSEEEVEVVLLGQRWGAEVQTSAHLTIALQHCYYNLVRLIGDEGARLAVQSRTDAIAAVEGIVIDEGIECSFERLDGYLLSTEDEVSNILDREQVTLHGLSAGAVEWVARSPLRPNPALRFLDQAQFDPLRYTHGLCGKIVENGCRLYYDSPVSTITVTRDGT